MSTSSGSAWCVGAKGCGGCEGAVEFGRGAAD